MFKNLPKASWVFVTHNRCPFNNKEKNPLVWSFQSLINNKYYHIDDYVVVDDFSNDHTKETIDWLIKKYGINIKYIKNSKRLGCSMSRNKGLNLAENELVFMGDDDCIYGEYFLGYSVLSYELLKSLKAKENIAILNLPVYEKNILPTGVVDSAIVGKTIFDQTFFYHEFDKFPKEYLKKPQYLDKARKLLMPLEIDTFKGVNLCNRAMLSRVGGYLDLSMWKSSYSEHIELSFKLKNFGFKMYHQSDIRCGCLHLKYGNLSKDRFDKELSNLRFKGLKYNLGEMINFAQKRNLNTGGRLSEYDFHFEEIGSFMSFYLKISSKLGIKFINDQYQRFVVNGFVFSTTPPKFIKNKKNREKLFLDAIKKGLEVTTQQTGKKYKSVKNYLKNSYNINI